MNKRVVRRLLETFFRRWYLYLLPLVLFTAVGAWRGLAPASGFRSVGVVDVSSGTLLSQLTSIRGENFGYETPAASTARTMNGLLGTGQFMESVAENAGVIGALQGGEVTLFDLRQSLYAAAAGDNLLNVSATTASPELSARLVRGTIEAFVDYLVAGDVSESAAAEQFFQDQVTTYQAELAGADQALADYLSTHPGGSEDERPAVEQVAIQRLQADVMQARDKVAAAQQKMDEARLATKQATEDVQQRLRIVDEPKIAIAPEPRLRQAAMTMMVFMFVGFLLSCAAVVCATVLDRSIWSADDIEHLFRLPVLAVVPAATNGRGSSVAERAPFVSVAAAADGAGAAVAVASNSTASASPRKPQSRTPARAARSRRSAATQSNEGTS